MYDYNFYATCSSCGSISALQICKPLTPDNPLIDNLAAPKIVHLGSNEEINDTSLGPLELYGRAKVEMLMLAKYGLVTNALLGTGDTVFSVSVHPGAVNTEMQGQRKRAYPNFFGQIASATMLTIGRNVEQGSYSALYTLTAPDTQEKNMKRAILC